MLTIEVNLGLAFLAGLASFLAPCVLPLVPAYLSYLSGYTFGQAEDADNGKVRRQVVAHAVFFVLGFSVIFILLGTAAGALGAFVRSDWLRYVGGGLVILFGLSLLGLVNLPFLYNEAKFSVERKPRLGIVSSLLAGVAFGAGWTPCVGPVLSSILILSADQATLTQGVWLLAIYSLGLGLPFILAGLLVDRLGGLIRRIAPYQPIIHKISGVLITIVGVLLITDGFSVIGDWLTELGIGWTPEL
jgi:cytochrome c-type biogenesis protein